MQKWGDKHFQVQKVRQYSTETLWAFISDEGLWFGNT